MAYRFLLPLFGALQISTALAQVSELWACHDSVSSFSPVLFELVLTEGDIGPDGLQRKGILMNGQFPGPALELCHGEDVEFHVSNELPYSITVHFHGIEQLGTPWSDGVPGVSQRGIHPGENFTYRWTATESGSYFYHAHQRGHMEDGLYGPIRIHPKASVERPFAMVTRDPVHLAAMMAAERNTSPILLSDFRRLTSEEVWNAEEETGLDAFCNNALMINGKGAVSCPSKEQLNELASEDQKLALNGSELTDIGCLPPTLSFFQGSYTNHNLAAVPDSLFWGCKPSDGPSEVLTVDAAALYKSWDLINAAGVSTVSFSIDQHLMYVYAVDGRYIEPVLVDSLKITPGRRFSVLMKLDKTPGNYTVRSTLMALSQVLNTTAVMTYSRPVYPSRPLPHANNLTSKNETARPVSLDETTLIPFPVEKPAQTVNQTFILTLDRFNSSYMWTLGNTSFPLTLEEDHPLLFSPPSTSLANPHFANLTIATKNNTWTDLIFHSTTLAQPEHPIHKHSNKMFLIGQGEGAWEWSSVADAMQDIPESFNLENPPIMDTVVTLPTITGPSWTAVRYWSGNPGAWVVHCHIQVHMSGGMNLVVLDGVDVWPEVPGEYLLD
ncbi:multicopper oxidase-domain-containing protein [Aspergillus karnatakaensis]|uniref:multicopper oxidase-domain-containing protein n=1 Tax=Aspergillus karnatakaensis TaxID=1810916 RepID=UPI003CCDAE8E